MTEAHHVRPYVGLFDRVTDAVLKEFPGVTLDALRGPCRMRHLVIPRQLSMWLLRELGHERQGYSYPQVARMFSGRDHTTAMWAIKRVEARRNIDPDFRALSDRLRLSLAPPKPPVLVPAYAPSEFLADNGELPPPRMVA